MAWRPASGKYQIIRRCFIGTRSHDRQIASGIILVSFFVLLGKLASAAKESAIAWRYGVHPSVDAYVFLLNLITMPIAVWFSLLTVILVPLHARHETESDTGDFHLFKRELLGFSMATGILLAVVAYIGVPLILHFGWSGLHGLAYQEASDMAGGMALIAPSGILISLFSAWLLAQGSHRNTLLEAIPAILILGFVLLPPEATQQPLVWGTVIGFTVQALFLKWAVQRQNPIAPPLLGFRSKAWKGIWQSLGIVAIGQTAMGLTGLVDQFFAAQLDGGAVSVLNYANRILSMLLSICVLAISRATLPIFSKATAAGDVDVAQLTSRWRNIGLIAGTCVAMAGWFLAHMTVAFVFERGAFHSHHTATVAEALQFGLFQLPFYIAGIVLYSANTGRQKYRQNGMAMLLAATFKVSSIWVLSPMFGTIGIQISTAIMYIVFFMALTHTSERSSHGAK